MLRRFFLTSAIATSLAACVPDDKTIPQPKYIGRWVEVLLGSDGSGFELFGDGTAASIDQSDLDYTNWRAKGDKLYLTSRQNEEVEYNAHFFNDGNSLELGRNGEDWPNIFRKID